MIGKMLLPLVGGTSSGWIVAMAFFQIMLLFGYFLSHMLSKFSAKIHGVLYLTCLILGCFFLPITLNKYVNLMGNNFPALDTFILLTIAVAIPFIAISATTSTIQKLFTCTEHQSAEDPYFLYAASNLGSLTGLLIYPFLVEPKLNLTTQSQVWFFGYMALFILSIICIFISKRKTIIEQKEKIVTPLSWKVKGEWIALSFIPSGLLFAVTNHITTDIFSLPLLWVIPLSLYLLTFIIAFSKKNIISYNVVLKLQPIVASVALALSAMGDISLTWISIPLHLISLAVIALMCHMRLANKRPLENNEHLTNFYLMIAIGGALGGVVNAFIAPAIFNYLYEYPIILVLSTLFNENIRTKALENLLYSVISVIIMALMFEFIKKNIGIDDLIAGLIFLIMFAIINNHPKIFFTGGTILCISLMNMTWFDPPLVANRNFYGIIKVYDKEKISKDGQVLNIRYMRHGTTRHGWQILNKEYNNIPTGYYSKIGPLNDVISISKKYGKIAVIGLGVGTINCYSTLNNKITFFEIDKEVIKIAKENFTFLSKCGVKTSRIILGDARLELKKLKKEKFDLIILDAFSSDTVPTHLLTKEAIELYLSRLNENGIIAFHTSNRYFSLEKPIAATANLLELKNLYRHDKGENKIFYSAPSQWLTLTKKEANFKDLKNKNWKEVKVPNKIKPWTDNYTDIISAIIWPTY